MATASELRKLLDGLRFKERVAAVSRWARAATDAELDPVLAELAAGDWHERSMAVFAAGLRGREPHLLEALKDPSQEVRRVAAVFFASRTSDTAALVEAVRAASPDTRRRLASAVARQGRSAAARPLAQALLELQDRRAVRPLLDTCDDSVIEALLADRGPRAVPWSRLARRKPALTLRLLGTQLSRASGEVPVRAAWSAFAAALPELARGHSDALLDLWQRHGPHASFPPFEGCWGLLLAAAPDRLVACVTRVLGLARGGLPKGLLSRVRRLSPPLLHALAKAVYCPTGLTELLSRLAPAARAGCFQAALQGLDVTRTVWPDTLLAVLPHEVRHAEARRILAMPEIQRDPAHALTYARWLPLDEALERLTPAQRGSKGEERAQAWRLRLEAIGANRRGLDEALTALERTKNEQDPVRAAAYEALAALPISLFRAEHAPRLLEFVEYAVNARDTSSSTRGALQRLAHRLLSAWANDPQSVLFQVGLKTLLRLAQQSPLLAFPKLERTLRRGAERPLVATLVPWLRKEVGRELNGNVLRLTEALGRRARGVEELQALLQEIVFTAASWAGWERSQAAAYWLDDPETASERMRKLLDWDESAVTLPAVWTFLHLHRQDWLDPFLEGRELTGRFASQKAGWLFPATNGFARWLPRQQLRFAETLGRFLEDDGQHLARRAQVVRVVAALQTTSVEALRPLLAHSEVAIVEAALGALVWLDDPAPALPLLLENLDSDRARVAMYAMPRLVRLLPQEAVLEALSGLLARPKLKVTVEKEALRLLGGLASPKVGELLRAEWAKEGLHRDVRVAALHAARARCELPVSWTILRDAVVHPDRDVARAVLHSAVGEVPVRFRSGYADLALQLGDHPAREVRTALVEHFCFPEGWGTVAPARAAELAAREVLSFAADAPWPNAAKALTVLAAHPEALEVLTTLVDGLVERARCEPVVAKPPAEDLPALRRLEALAGAFASVAAEDRARTAVARAALLARTASLDAWLWNERTALALADLPARPESAEALRRLARAAPTSLDAAELDDAVCRWAADRSRPCEATVLLDLAAGLHEEHEPWVALGLVRAAGARFGWSAAARAELGRLRGMALVAVPARKVRIG